MQHSRPGPIRCAVLRTRFYLWRSGTDSEIDFHPHSGAAANAAAAAIARMPVRRAWAIHWTAMTMLPERPRMHPMLHRSIAMRRRPGRRSAPMEMSRRNGRNDYDYTLLLVNVGVS